MSPTDAEAATPEASPHLFSADRPISSKREDLLGRAPYARSLFEPEGLRDLVDLCLEKIRAAARSGRLAQGPRLLALLHQWERWSPGEPGQWVAELIGSKDGLLAFLRGSLSRVLSQTAGNYLPEVRYEIRLGEIEPFVPVEEVSSAVEGLAEGELGPEDRQAVEGFRRALRRRA